MKKRVFCLLLALALMLGLSLPVFAENDWPKVMDEAGLLTAEEQEALEARAQQIAETYGMDVVIVTNDSLDGKTATEYADDYFDYNDYGIGPYGSGTLLLVSMGERDWAISTKGKAIRAVTDWGNEQLQDAMLPDLSNGDYADAFNNYLDELETLYDSYTKDQANGSEDGSSDYDGSEDYDGPIFWYYLRSKLSLGRILLCMAIAAVISGITVASMAKSMNSARGQRQAREYLVKDSFHLSQSRDRFLYSTVTKTRRAQEEDHGGGSSTHVSSSGSTHGGSSGKF